MSISITPNDDITNNNDNNNIFYDIPNINETIRECTSTFCKNEIISPNPLAKIIKSENIYTFIFLNSNTILIDNEIHFIDIKFNDLKNNSQKLINQIMQLNIKDKYINYVYEDILNFKEIILIIDSLLIKAAGIFIIPYSVFLSTGLGIFNSIVVDEKYISLTEDSVLIETINNLPYNKSLRKIIDYKDEISLNFRPFICICGDIFENIKHLTEKKHEEIKEEYKNEINLQKILEIYIKKDCSIKEKYKLIKNKKKLNTHILLLGIELPDFIKESIKSEDELNILLINKINWNIKDQLINNDNINIFNKHLLFYEKKMEKNENIEYEGIELLKNGIYREIDIILISSIIYRHSTDVYELYTSKKEWSDFGIRKLKENILFFI